MSVGAAFDWRDRQVSAAEAVSVVRSGDRVFVGSACATPRALVEALEKLRLPGVVLVHFLTDRVGAGDPPARDIGIACSTSGAMSAICTTCALCARRVWWSTFRSR